MSAMYPHTVTVWGKAGEEGRRAVWRRRTLDGVRYETSVGDDPSFLLMVPAVFSGYVSPADLADGRGLAPAEWTLRKGDRVAPGESLEPEPPAGARTVSQAGEVRLGRRILHIEASGS